MRRALEWLGGSVLVYALMAACSGGSKTAATVGHAGQGEAQGGDAVALVGGAPNTASGARSAEAGLGGILDPVPNAGAQEAGSGPGPVAPALSYTETTVDCDQLLKVVGTNYPAAILDLQSPSVVVAAATVHVMNNGSAYDPGWVQASTGGIIRDDGSRIAVQCAKAADSVTFYVPSF